jgi:hypothetical protein
MRKKKSSYKLSRKKSNHKKRSYHKKKSYHKRRSYYKRSYYHKRRSRHIKKGGGMNDNNDNNDNNDSKENKMKELKIMGNDIKHFLRGQTFSEGTKDYPHINRTLMHIFNELMEMNKTIDEFIVALSLVFTGFALASSAPAGITSFGIYYLSAEFLDLYGTKFALKYSSNRIKKLRLISKIHQDQEKSKNLTDILNQMKENYNNDKDIKGLREQYISLINQYMYTYSKELHYKDVLTFDIRDISKSDRHLFS